MKTTTILIAVVFSAVATVWSAGPDGSLPKHEEATEATHPATESETSATSLSDSIRQFVWELRSEALERWFSDWDAAEDSIPDPLADNDWSKDAITDPQHRAMVESEVEAEGSGSAVSAAASGSGTAVSMAVVDGRYEIEAAYSGTEGPRRFRVRGTREQVQRWAAELPQPLRQVVQRQLASTDLDGPAW